MSLQTLFCTFWFLDLDLDCFFRFCKYMIKLTTAVVLWAFWQTDCWWAGQGVCRAPTVVDLIRV